MAYSRLDPTKQNTDPKNRSIKLAILIKPREKDLKENETLTNNLTGV